MGDDALVILAEWKEFRSTSFEEIRQKLLQPIVVDGRNLFDPEVLAKEGMITRASAGPSVSSVKIFESGIGKTVEW
jgi:UDPglucose 6-dehydrogenase